VKNFGIQIESNSLLHGEVIPCLGGQGMCDCQGMALGILGLSLAKIGDVPDISHWDSGCIGVPCPAGPKTGQVW